MAITLFFARFVTFLGLFLTASEKTLYTIIFFSLDRIIQLIKLQKDTIQDINKLAIPHKYTFGDLKLSLQKEEPNLLVAYN